MKRLTGVLTVVILLAAMAVLAGCSKESEEMFTITVKDIQLTVGESQKITASGGFTAHSTDEQVATVTADGTITAVSAGEADVVFTSTEDAAQQQTCHVTADWRYHYFDEPILDFSLNLEQIKARESHRLVIENHSNITYQYDTNGVAMNVTYYYDGFGISGVSCEYEPTEENNRLVLEQTNERFPLKDGNGHYRLKSDGGHLYCSVEVYDGQYVGKIHFHQLYFL